MLPNSSVSDLTPGLQLWWDSTSLGALKTCPRYYKFTILEGWVPRQQSVHLTFGLHYHAALERYDHAKAEGLGHEEALDRAVAYCLESTWNYELGRPWLSDEPTKTRWTLLRTVVWYLDNFKEDTLKTLVLANGKPAVELSFQFQTTYSSPEGEPYTLCGHFDRIAEAGDSDLFVVDRKTTKGALDQRYFASFSPDIQFTLYTLAGQVVFGLPLKGIVLDAAQIGIGFSRFARVVIPKPAPLLEEFYSELRVWLDTAEHYARLGVWPANEKSCGHYNGCPFRGVCSQSPGLREDWLKAGFVKRVWDPRQIRGNIA